MPDTAMLVPAMEPGMMPNMGMFMPNMGMFPYMPGQPLGIWQPEPVDRRFRVYIGELPTDVTDVSFVQYFSYEEKIKDDTY